jgi:hypothetical protein
MKCIFSSESESCKRCLKRNLNPCVKQYGPKKELQLSRPLLQSSEHAIAERDVLALQWLYFGQEYVSGWSVEGNRFLRDIQWEIFDLAKAVVPIYGPSITCQPLRCALTAFADIMVSEGKFGERQEDSMVKVERIHRRYKLKSDFGEGDLFASVLLAVISAARPDPISTEFNTFCIGFFAILEVLSNASDQSRNGLKGFWPMARDLLFGVPPNQIQAEEFCKLYKTCRYCIGPPTLEQRQMYLKDDFTALCVNLHYHEKVLSKVVTILVSQQTRALPPDTIDTLFLMVTDVSEDLEVVERFMSNPRSIKLLSERDLKETVLGLRTEWLSPVSSIRYSMCRILSAVIARSQNSFTFTGMDSEKVTKDALTMLGFVSRIKIHDLRGKLGQQLYGSNLCRRAIAVGALSLPLSAAVGDGMSGTL